MTPKVAAICVHIEKKEFEVTYSRPYAWYLPKNIKPVFGDVLMVENHEGVALVMYLTSRLISEEQDHPQKYVLQNLGKVERYLVPEFSFLLEGIVGMIDNDAVLVEELQGGCIHYWIMQNPVVMVGEVEEETPRRERSPRKSQTTEIE